MLSQSIHCVLSVDKFVMHAGIERVSTILALHTFYNRVIRVDFMTHFGRLIRKRSSLGYKPTLKVQLNQRTASALRNTVRF
jgi:hypothetical protein